MWQLSKQKTGLPIAMISGGKLRGKRVYLKENLEDMQRKNKSNAPNPYILQNILKDKGIKLGKEQYNELYNVIHGREPEEGTEDDILGDVLQEYQKELDKQITISSGKMEVLPTPFQHQTDAIYCSGARGSGKSTWASMYIKQYHKMYPSNDIIIISSKAKDRAFKDLKYLKKLEIDEDMIDDPIELREIRDSLVIFDDYEAYPKKIQQVVNNLRDKILMEGRSKGISTLILQHVMFNHKATRTQLYECNAYTVFSSAPKTALKRALIDYLGLSTEQYKRILKLPSRWYFITKNIPQYCIYEHGVMLL